MDGVLPQQLSLHVVNVDIAQQIYIKKNFREKDDQFLRLPPLRFLPDLAEGFG